MLASKFCWVCKSEMVFDIPVSGLRTVFELNTFTLLW